MFNPTLQAQFDYTMVKRNINPYAPVSESAAHREYEQEYQRLVRGDEELKAMEDAA